MANFAIGSMGLALQYLTWQYKNAAFTIYSGTQPTTPETGIAGGNIVLASFTLGAVPFQTYTTASGYNTQNASFVSQVVTPTNSGTASFARATLTTVASHSGAWTAGTVYAIGDIVISNSAYWVCYGAGTAGATAPIGNHLIGFNDGGAIFSWLQPTSQGTALADFTIGTSNADIIANSVNFVTTINQTISFAFGIPAV